MIEPTNGTPQPTPPQRPATGDPIQVLIADHDGLARCMIRTALHEDDRVAIVLTASDGREALELLRHYRPTITIIDLGLPPHGALELITTIQQTAPDTTRILTISSADQQAALATLRAGAIGHINKDTDPNELARQVIRAAVGHAIVPPPLIKPLLELLHQLPDTGWRPLHSRLTTREWEIVELIAHGATTQHIADHLVLSQTTIYSHVKSLMRKLGVHTRHQAVTAAETLRHQEARRKKHPTPNR